jgi:hypothetical protein
MALTALELGPVLHPLASIRHIYGSDRNPVRQSLKTSESDALEVAERR